MAARKPKDAWQETRAGKMYEPTLWMAEAACRSHPERQVFFPPRGAQHGGVSKARVICATCPVWKECLDYALTNHIYEGIWGGTSVRDRAKIKNIKNMSHCSKCGLINHFAEREHICEKCKGTSSQRHNLHG